MQTAPIFITYKEASLLINMINQQAEGENLFNLRRKIMNIKEAKLDQYSPEAIIDEVCRITHYSIECLRSKSREERIVFTRAALSKLIYDNVKSFGTPQIGRLINRDHATILHYFQNIENVKEFREYYQKVKSEIEIS